MCMYVLLISLFSLHVDHCTTDLTIQMASNRAKLSLRRPKKTLGTSKDKHTSEFPSSHGDQALPIVSVATEDVAEVSESTVVSDSVASGSSERRKSGDDDFHPLSRVAGRKRKSPHSDHTK